MISDLEVRDLLRNNFCKLFEASHFRKWINEKKVGLFTNYASQCQEQRRDKQGQAGTKQGQAGTRHGQTEIGREKQGHSLFCPCLSLFVPVCPCLSMLVPACPCLSLSIPVCPCLSLSVSVCPSLSLSIPVCPSIPLHLIYLHAYPCRWI